MGYTIHQLETKFFIPRTVKSEALVSIKALTKDFFEARKQMAFIELTDVERSENLEQALSAARWLPEINERGDIIGIEFTGEKLGDDYQIFNSIARYVKNDGFITFLSEDGEVTKVWRWLFLNGSIIEQKGQIVFE